MSRLAGKTALVTGAARGIGRGIARRFAQEGAFVGALDLPGDALNETVALIEADGGNGLALSHDLRQPEDVKAAVKALNDAAGTIGIVMNNAAVMPAGTLHETSLADWDRVFAVNVRGAYLVNQAVIPQMLEAGQGSILHMASVTGMLGLPGLAAYSSTKGALIALTRAMSTDYASQGIRVNSISPGTIDSPMLAEFLEEQSNPEPLRAQFDAMHPIGRIGTIGEVASLCVFLASDEASFMTGSNYTVDGGLSTKGEQPQD